MSAAAAMAPPPRLDSVLSFGDAAAAATEDEAATATARAFSDAASDDDDDEEFGFEFAFAPPLAPGGALALAPADDLFSHGRIVPAYPVFDRHLLDDVAPTVAPPSPDTYCDWAPRSAPGSPTRAAFPKSKSAGEARRHHHWRLRDLVALGGGRSRSDGKEKFVFLQPAAAGVKQAAGAATKPTTPSAEASAPRKQSKRKGGKVKATTEMDMATAHRLFYGAGKQQQQGAGGDRRQQQQQSYLPYRPAIVGFFATAHALGRSRHPY